VKTKIAILFELLCIASVASQPPLNELGQPFLKPDCETVWAATNKLPETLWVYRVLPSTFSPGVISNLVVLGSFGMTNKAATLGRRQTDPRSICFSTDKRSLGIYPRWGFIEYRYPQANDNKTTNGVPTEVEAQRLGANWIGLLSLDRSEISNMEVYTPAALRFKHEPAYQVITNVYSRYVGFGRRLDGVDFYNKAEGCSIEFAHDAVIAQMWLSWRNLERDKLYPVAKPETILKWMREGKCFWQWWAPDAQGMDSSVFKKVTIKSATPFYYGADRDESQDWVYPFVYLETAVDMTITNTIIPPGEVNFKLSEITNVFKTYVRNITNQTVFICCPIIDAKAGQR